MKKTYLKLLNVLVILCISLSLTSCSNDDDDEQEEPSNPTEVSIVGKWELVNATYTNAPKTMIFEKGGTGSNSVDGNMTWNLAGTALTIKGHNTLPITCTVTKLTATEFSYQVLNLTANYRRLND